MSWRLFWKDLKKDTVCCCCVDVHAGGSFLKQTRFVIFFGGGKPIFLFVDVALRAASILKNDVCCIFSNFLYVAKLVYLLGFEPREYAKSVSFETCCRMHLSTSHVDVWSPSYDHIWTGLLGFWERVGSIFKAS